MDYTFVSVIMPIRNEEKYIERSLGAVLRQDYPPEHLEVIIADGMSTDATLEIIRGMEGHERVRIVPNPQIIQATGLNEAIRQAKGEVIIRVDGHAAIVPTYVSTSLRLLQETGAACVGGPLGAVGLTYIGKAIAAASQSRFSVPSAYRSSHKAQFTDMVFIGSWRKEVLESVGLFNPDLVINEDYELNYRIRKNGGKIYFSPELYAEYFGRQTLRDLAWQYFRYGLWKVNMLRLHPSSVRPRQIVPPLFVAILVLGALLGILIPEVFVLWLLVLGSYLFLDIAFSVLAASRSSWDLLLILPLIFPIYHIAWGLGFWVGIFTGLNALKR